MAESERDRIKLKFWQDSGVLTKIAGIADNFYDFFEEKFAELTGQIDVDTAPIKLVELLAWERDIERFKTEDEAFFRKRVKYALLNAKDAGSKKGFERIWERLGLGDLTQVERFDEENWDVIRLGMDETIFGQYAELLEVLIRQYGRTCRRYWFETTTVTVPSIRTFDVNAEMSYTVAKFDVNAKVAVQAKVFDFSGNFFNTKAVAT